ncbi:MAG: DUF4174 domain-containing protein [Bacteroidota bacterium]
MKFLMASMLLFSWLMNGQEELDQYQWKHRLIVIHAPLENDSLGIQQYQMLQPYKQDMIERKLKVILRKAVDKEQGFSVILLGLDGGEKFTSNKVTSWETFRALIDAMPMRKAELRKKGN